VKEQAKFVAKDPVKQKSKDKYQETQPPKQESKLQPKTKEVPASKPEKTQAASQ
jgi:hypothetical protein